MPLPDFFVIGAPKAGSTALHSALSRHPHLYLSAVKEPKFFLTDGRRPPRPKGPGDAHSAREWIWAPERYDALFAPAQGRLAGESTPFYLWDRAAQHRIAAAVPNARLIAIVRDPVDRAYSNWTHLWCDGLEPEADFRAACAREQARAAAGWGPFWRYLDLGSYGAQLEDLYTSFDRSQVLVLRYRELIDEPARTLDGICSFLGVQTGLLDRIGSANVSTWVPDSAVNTVLRRAIRAGAAAGRFAPPAVWRTVEKPLRAALHRHPSRGGHRVRPRPDPQVRAELIASFAEDIGRLEQVTGRSFADWRADAGRGTYAERRS